MDLPTKGGMQIWNNMDFMIGIKMHWPKFGELELKLV